MLLGFLGPFGTNPVFDRTERYAFWLGLGLTGYGCGFIARKLLGSSPRFARRSAPLLALLAALLSAIPQTFIVFWAMSLLQPGRTASVGALALLFVAVTAVQLILLTAIVLVERRSLSLPRQAGTEEPPRTVLKESQPVALEAEDHYVRVHKVDGSKLVLQRLSDAVAEVSGIDGLQVHRGWWVASAAVAGTYVEDGRRWVRLINGLTIPVSRARRRDVLARGWPQL